MINLVSHCTHYHVSTGCEPVRLFSMSALKKLHRDQDLITEEECRRFGKLSRERHLHAFSLAVDKHIIRMKC